MCLADYGSLFVADARGDEGCCAGGAYIICAEETREHIVCDYGEVEGDLKTQP